MNTNVLHNRITDREVRLRDLGPYRFMLTIAFHNRTDRLTIKGHMCNFMNHLAITINDNGNFPYEIPMSGAFVVPRPHNNEGDPMMVHVALRDHPLLSRSDDHAQFELELLAHSSMNTCFPKDKDSVYCEEDIADVRAHLMSVEVDGTGSNEMIERLQTAATSGRAIFKI